MRIMTGHEKGKTWMELNDNGRELATSSGVDAQDAAEWLMHHVDRIVADTTKLLLDMGLDPTKRPKGV
jgi:hypothetical protein